MYGTTTPPEIDLSRVKVKFALFMGQFDSMASIGDNKEVIEKLPSGAVAHCKIFGGLGHFIIGEHKNVSWFEHVLPVLEEVTSPDDDSWRNQTSFEIQRKNNDVAKVNAC